MIQSKLKLNLSSRLMNSLPHEKSYSAVTIVSDNISVPFAAKYDSKVIEKGKYEKWLCSEYFCPKIPFGNVETFSLILPPPNVTGTLHLGHALTVTLQDILCRWKRMMGCSVLWVPGTDHAGIATQVMVEKQLQTKNGKTRHDIGRDKFLEFVDEWKTNKMEKINEQIKQLGASVDWSNYFFTMDANQSKAVTAAIIKLFDDGLLYKNQSFVNWCPYLMSTISDYEIEYINVQKATQISMPGCPEPVEFGKLYDFVFKVVDRDDAVQISTTRPETIFGDTAVAVNPNDSRYTHLKGLHVRNPLNNSIIPVVFDEIANPTFGTGALKVTPSLSDIDFGIAQRHNLPIINILTESGHMNNECGEFANLHRFVARRKVLDRLSQLGFLRCVKEHNLKLPVCSRTGDVIERIMKNQWFVKCEELAKRAISEMANGNMEILPEKHKDIYFRWLNDHRDWCISRQIWWGHQLPLYETEHGWVAAYSEHEAYSKAREVFGKDCKRIKRDEDVLDTWFSSALLPFSALGWPHMSEFSLMKKFYPLNLMETGSDILNFWVIRMIMLGLYFTDQVPFRKILLHGMVCDSRGRKMSKSKGNVIEFDNIINGITLKELNEIVKSNQKSGLLSESESKYALKFQKELFPDGIAPCGADALRLTLASLESQDQVIKFNPVTCRENTAYCNKMWQASKFIIGWCLHLNVSYESTPNPQTLWEKWILHRLWTAVETINNGLERMDFRTVSIAIKKFIVKDLCDTYLELTKPVLKNGNQRDSKSAITAAIHCLETALRLSAPITPFVCDELYSYLPKNNQELWLQKYPISIDYRMWENNEVNDEIFLVRELVTASRALIQITKCQKNNSEIIVCSEKNPFLKKYTNEMKTLTRCKSVEYSTQVPKKHNLINTFKNIATVHIINLDPNAQDKVRENLKLLRQQTSSPIREINDRIQTTKVKNSIEEPAIQRFLSEWNEFQIEIDTFFSTHFDRKELEFDNLQKAAKLVLHIHDMKYRLSEELKNKRSSGSS